MITTSTRPEKRRYLRAFKLGSTPEPRHAITANVGRNHPDHGQHPKIHAQNKAKRAAS